MSAEEFHAPAPRIGVIDKLTKDCAELKARGETRKILFCFSTDPYQPINDRYQLTRQAIEILHFYGQSVSILTKGGHRASVDIPLLRSGDEFAVTLTCDNDKPSLEWEPGAALPAERITTLKEAKDHGIFTWVSLEPVLYPEQSLELIRQTHAFTDKYKLGVLNYHSREKEIDWKQYGSDAIKLLESLGKDYYIKDDLKAKL
jgi:DNA repair photolyase